ncbi:MAG: erythromycin esterase family protein [Herminiimonas sp.]|nr:erythromycin esterase family protein [Herminiimonas sp.]
MSTPTNSPLSIAISSAAHLLNGTHNDYDPLLDLIGDAHFVLLGEATHGTHEFYQERARITQRLVAEKNFSAVAVEADWPDAYNVNRYVRGTSTDSSSELALSGFQRFPTWMWRNRDVVQFIDWLRGYNDSLEPDALKTGFYGLDLYSLFTSIDEVLGYLDNVDPEGARRARARYACFDHFYEDSQRYGYAASLGLSQACEEQVIAQLRDLRKQAKEYKDLDSQLAKDEFFYAEQNARLVKNAEQYYRSMFQDRISSWNLRDRHMAETLSALAQHLSQPDRPAKIVVWEHNSHIGDARATEIGRQGEWNVGQLAREQYGGDAVLIGFTTYQGTVTAASEWDAPAERKRVRPALAGSYEEAFHQTGMSRFMLPLRGKNPAAQALASSERLERAIGVIYLPQTERQSHYFRAQLPQQFDAVLHFDETQAVEPLELTSGWHEGEAPATFPVGL